jgi:hypothetical protein
MIDDRICDRHACGSAFQIRRARRVPFPHHTYKAHVTPTVIGGGLPVPAR